MSKSLPAPPSLLSYQGVSLLFGGCFPGDDEKGFVPGYHFRIHDCENNDMGHLNVRVGNNDHIRFAAGHIGYEISEEYRGNGYAALACLALGNWVTSVLDEILITVDLDNPASIRTIEKIEAEFVAIVDVPKGDPHYERGVRQKRLYRWSPVSPPAGIS